MPIFFGETVIPSKKSMPISASIIDEQEKLVVLPDKLNISHQYFRTSPVPSTLSQPFHKSRSPYYT